MNTSTVLNQSLEEENQLILYIMNFLFDYLKTNKLDKLSSLLEENIINSLILEMYRKIFKFFLVNLPSKKCQRN